MRLTGIPVIRPVPLTNDPLGPMGSPQPILQFKELTVDMVRYKEWKAACERERRKRNTEHAKAPRPMLPSQRVSGS